MGGLTDSAEWRVYNAYAPVPVEHKLFRAVRVAEDLDAAFELLALLSKGNIRDNRIQVPSMTLECDLQTAAFSLLERAPCGISNTPDQHLVKAQANQLLQPAQRHIQEPAGQSWA
jgi:hypothetical protein